MFKKENSNRRAVDDATTVVNDFKLRSPFWSYRNVDYKTPEWYSNMKPIIDARLSELAQKGALDPGTEDVLDPLIEDWVDEAKAELQKQREKHKDLNIDLEIRKETDFIAIVEQERICKDKLLESRRRTKTLSDLYDSYEGRKEFTNVQENQ